MVTEWWNSLDLFMKILWGIAIGTSLIFIVQSILTFIGLDSGGGDFDTDIDPAFNMDPNGTFDTDPSMNLLTFRNLVNFFLGFSWTAIVLKENISSMTVVLILSVLAGVLLVAAVMYMFRWLSVMQQSGNIDLHSSAAGSYGKVYLTIPAERTGTGKVQISINDSVREYDAVTDGTVLPTGTPIKVTGVIDSSTLLVEPQAKHENQ